jgi:hypothetical protein
VGQLTYKIDLSSAWAKVRRSEALIDGLRRDIWDAGSPDPYVIPVRRSYDAAGEAVVFEIDHLITIADDWTLILGDALHDLRSAINHLAWQLALRLYDGVAPTDRRVVLAIQYPIVLKEANWAGNRNWPQMTSDDAAIVKTRQPFQPLRPGEELHPLKPLMVLNDVDKHQNIHLVYAVTEFYDLIIPIPPDRFIDCEEDVSRVGSTGIHGYDFAHFGERLPQPGDEVMRCYVRPTGPAPDVDWEVRLAGHLHIGEAGDILKALDAIYEYVVAVIRDFGAAPPNVRFTLSRIPKNWPHKVSVDYRPPDFTLYWNPPSGPEG